MTTAIEMPTTALTAGGTCAITTEIKENKAHSVLKTRILETKACSFDSPINISCGESRFKIKNLKSDWYILKAVTLLAESLKIMDDLEKENTSDLLEKGFFKLLEEYYDSKYQSITIFVALLIKIIQEAIEETEVIKNVLELKVEGAPAA